MLPSLKNNSRVNSVMSAQPEKRYFNVDEYYRMAQAGVLTPDDRIELIEGEIIKISEAKTLFRLQFRSFL